MAMRTREDDEVYPNAAAIDVGASSHWVAVPRTADDHPYRSFAQRARTSVSRLKAVVQRGAVVFARSPAATRSGFLLRAAQSSDELVKHRSCRSRLFGLL